MNWFNYIRIHGTLDYLSPIEYKRKHLKKLSSFVLTTIISFSFLCFFDCSFLTLTQGSAWACLSLSITITYGMWLYVPLLSLLYPLYSAVLPLYLFLVLLFIIPLSVSGIVRSYIGCGHVCLIF